MQVLTYIYIFSVWCVGTMLLRVVSRFEPKIPGLPSYSGSSSSQRALRQLQAGLCASGLR
jgi:hypothetical protein